MKKYIRLVWIEFKKGKEYSLNFIGQLIYLPIKLIIIYYIWKFVYSHSSTIANYTFTDMVGYYILLKIFENGITPVGITAYEVWTDINQGNLNLFLSKPIFYPFYLFYNKIGYFIWGLTSGFVFLLCIKLFLPVGLELELGRIILSVLSLFLGFIIMYTLFFCVGSLTFWVENILTLRDNLWNVIRILSGQIFPIALFPGLLRDISSVLPFQHIYYVPITIFQGKVNDVTLIKLLIGQFTWVGIMIFLSVLLWTSGAKRYAAQGG